MKNLLCVFGIHRWSEVWSEKGYTMRMCRRCILIQFKDEKGKWRKYNSYIEH